MKTFFIGLALVLCTTMVHAQTVYEVDGTSLKITKTEVVEEVKTITLPQLQTVKVRAHESLQRIYDEYMTKKQELLDEIIVIDLQIVEAKKLGMKEYEEVIE